MKTVVLTGVWVQGVGSGGEGPWKVGGEKDSGRLAWLNCTVRSCGSEESLGLLSRRGLDQIKKILP